MVQAQVKQLTSTVLAVVIGVVIAVVLGNVMLSVTPDIDQIAGNLSADATASGGLASSVAILWDFTPAIWRLLIAVAVLGAILAPVILAQRKFRGGFN